MNKSEKLWQEYHLKLREKLRKSEERFRRIFETANNGVKELDSESRYTFVNESFADMLGYHVQDLTGKSAYNYIINLAFLKFIAH